MNKTALHVLALTAATVLMMAAECGKPAPTPSDSICGVKDGEIIYCQVPPETSATPGMDPK